MPTNKINYSHVLKIRIWKQGVSNEVSFPNAVNIVGWITVTYKTVCAEDTAV